MAEPAAVVVRETDEPTFVLSTRFTSRLVVVGVRGEIDMVTAPILGGVLSALIDAGHVNLVIDGADLDFMGATGLTVIAVASVRLRSASGALSIRSPSAMVRRILDLTGMLALVEMAPPASPATVIVPGPVQVSSLPDARGVIDAALRLVTALARATVAGADGVSVALTRHGQLTTVAASDDTIAQMDRDQYATGEGPCVAAAAEGRGFYIESLAEEVRWPRFVPRAIDGGIASILSTPLMVAARPVGSLNIYSNTARAFGSHDQELATLFADQAAGLLADTSADMTVDEVAQRLRDALTTREVIAQAQGVVMAQQGISADTAYAAIRQHCKRAGTTVRERSLAIVAATRHDDLIGQVTT